MKTLRAAVTAAVFALCSACNDTNNPVPPAVVDTPVASRLELRDGMRQLWTEHVFYTRTYVISALSNLPDKQATLDRLLRNQTDLGNAMKPYYGDAFGEKLTDLLETHIKQAGEIVAAAAAGNTTQVASLVARWRENGAAIADFIADANPKIDRAALQMSMQIHLDTTIAEVTARIEQDWVQDVVAYDAVQDHAIMMADFLTDGTAALYPQKVTAPAITDREQALHLALRELWHDHVAWTRLFIISDTAGLPDVAATTARLLKNQEDLGNAIKPFYGAAAGDQLTALLKQHILGAVDVVHAAKSGDQAAVTTTYAAWVANADQIAAFLSGANPFLELEHLTSELHTHLEITVNEVTNRLMGKYPEEIQAYDAGLVHMLHFSDGLASGISQQFPAQFSAR